MTEATNLKAKLSHSQFCAWRDGLRSMLEVAYLQALEVAHRLGGADDVSNVSAICRSKNVSRERLGGLIEGQLEANEAERARALELIDTLEMVKGQIEERSNVGRRVWGSKTEARFLS